MKKYCYLFSVTLLILALIIMSGFMLGTSETESAVYTVREQDMDNTVTASGRLQYQAGYAVRLPSAAIIREVAVRNGETVKEGDLLLSYYQIDDAYLALASQYTGITGMESLISSVTRNPSVSELWEEVKKYCQVIEVNAEYEGTVNDISVSADEFTEKNSTVMKIAQHDTLEIPVNINETNIALIHPGQKADITFHAIPDRSFRGTVTSVSEEASQTSGMTGKETTVEVILTLDETDDELRVGYSAGCSIVTSTDRKVLVLPYDLLQTEEDENYVYVYRKGRAVRTPVITGTEYRTGIAVESGLKPGDRIITETEQVTDGQRIRIKEQTEDSHA